MFLGPTRRLRMRWQSFTVTTTSGFSGKTRHKWQRRCWCKRFKSLRGLLFPPIQVHQARQHERVQQVVAEVIIMCHLTPIAEERLLKVYFHILLWNLVYVLLRKPDQVQRGRGLPRVWRTLRVLPAVQWGQCGQCCQAQQTGGLLKNLLFEVCNSVIWMSPESGAQTAFFLVFEVYLLCNVCLLNRLCFYCSRVCLFRLRTLQSTGREDSITPRRAKPPASAMSTTLSSPSLNCSSTTR